MVLTLLPLPARAAGDPIYKIGSDVRNDDFSDVPAHKKSALKMIRYDIPK